MSFRSLCRGIWPVKPIADWLEWRRRDREETLVATITFTTTFTSGGKPTGEVASHVLALLIDGNGTRYTRTTSSNASAAGCHSGLIEAGANWNLHGDVPACARRVSNTPRGKLVVFPGGAA